MADPNIVENGDKMELKEDPKSTWGASPEYIKKWHEKFGKKEEDAAPRSADAKKSEAKVEPKSGNGNGEAK